MIEAAALEKVSSYLSAIKEKASASLELQVREQSVLADALPRLRRVKVFADFRGAIKKPYSYEQDVREYKPQCLGVAPCVILYLDLLDAPVDALAVQLDAKTLSILAAR